jgi:hypothetical protein
MVRTRIFKADRRLTPLENAEPVIDDESKSDPYAVNGEYS